jgi:hypothetical protein
MDVRWRYIPFRAGASRIDAIEIRALALRLLGADRIPDYIRFRNFRRGFGSEEHIP